ncbi:hypothetical protein KI743_23145, partial [Vibrio sp. D420a]|nr:hypothetical protein [Vibrio sp. D420a]
GSGSGSTGSNANVVGAINNMNSNVNKALDELTLDINNIGSNIEGGLTNSTEAINSNGEKISNELASGFGDLNGSLGGIKGSLDGVQGSLDGIQGSLDELSNVDTSNAGTGSTCISDSSCRGFYRSRYPNGLSGVANEHFQLIKANALDGFVDTFGTLDLSNAKRPTFAIPIMDFGTFDLSEYFDFDWLFGFVRFCLIFTAIATARKNILGG